MGGVAAAAAFCRRLGGTQFDPSLTELLCARGAELLDGLDTVRTWTADFRGEQVIEVVPHNRRAGTAENHGRLNKRAVAGVELSRRTISQY